MLRWFVFFCCLMFGCLAHADGLIVLQIGTQTVTLERAVTASEQRQGLSERASLPENHGMLFEIRPPRQVAMWMKNTRMDLDAAFFDECGKLLNIESMRQGTLDLHHSFGAAASVIEMPRGWFAAHDVLPGSLVPELSVSNHCPK